MMDKDFQLISDSDLEAVAGGMNLAVFSRIKTYDEAVKYLLMCGIYPGQDEYEMYLALWAEPAFKK